ncbi:hypothetical protein GCM10008932_21780 [Alkalibacterium iburiense]|uniref:PH domain-containing protein n=1 Tax=Alkalibacterium iburiense TaxID=290589 RepID=A0ABN0XPX5_9LACT
MLIVFQIRQIKPIKLFHRLPKSLFVIILLIISVFGGMAYALGETVVDYLFFLTPAISLILSLFNRGLTNKTVLPLNTGNALRNMYPQAFPFEETKDWIVIEQKKRLKVRFALESNENLPTVYYIYFDKDQLEDLKDHLFKQRLVLDVQK